MDLAYLDKVSMASLTGAYSPPVFALFLGSLRMHEYYIRSEGWEKIVNYNENAGVHCYARPP